MIKYRRLVTKWSEETLERIKFDRDTLNQEGHRSNEYGEIRVWTLIHRTLRVDT